MVPKKFWVLVLLVLLGLLLWAYNQRAMPPSSTAVSGPAQKELEQIPSQPTKNYVLDVSAHSVEELDVLFGRVEALLDRPRSSEEAPLVSLVLHGPEVEFFALKNYSQYKSLVDRAARLDALGAVDISICQTMMKNYGIGSNDVPGFLNQVPFGPDEVEQLIREGYVRM